MKGAVLFSLLLATTGVVRAESCSEADSEGARQSCFDAARQCVSIEADAERLACFDKAYAGEPLEASSGADTGGSDPVELTATPAEYAARNSGSLRTDRVESTIVAITTNAHNIDFLKLENGHTWRENEDSRVRFRIGAKVMIEQGMFGAFNLNMEGAPRAVKVKRVE